MKKVLLTLPLFIFAAGVNAQFTQSNAPALGDKLNMYTLDTVAPSYSEITGNNVTWDYSSYTGSSTANALVEVVDPSGTQNGADFTSSSLAIAMNGEYTGYYSVDANGMTTQGIVFEEFPVTGGEVLANFTSDDFDVFVYPMDLGSTIEQTGDVFPASVYAFSTMATAQVDMELSREIDGKGTLILAENTYNDVLRYKIRDTLKFMVTQFGTLPVDVYHTQYEYYDFTVSNLPVFIYSEINLVTVPGPALTNAKKKFIYSYEKPGNVNISTNELEKTRLYPNPATAELNITLPSSVTQANMVMTDALGREIMRKELNQIYSSIDVSSLNSGTYFVRMESNENRVVKSIVIK